MTDFTTSVLERIQQQTAEFEAKRKALQEELRLGFPEMFKEVFENYPEIHRFSWVQYTPYFNDGEECTFSVGDINAFGGPDGGDYWEDDETLIEGGERIAAWKHYLETGKFPVDFYKYYTEEDAIKRGHENREAYILSTTYIMPETVRKLNLDNLDRAAEVAMAASVITTSLTRIPDDFFKSLFGDHVNVSVTRNGVEVEDYDHD